MYIYKKDGLPIKIWADEGEIEDSALKQIENAADLPFAFHHVAGMPDMHTGFGVPIGGVAALNGIISPNMVGVDIGCGMRAIRTSLTEISKEKLKEWMSEIRKVVPVGFKHHEKPHRKYMPDVNTDMDKNIPNTLIIDREWTSACRQIGTLGGGNHFIEIQKGDGGYIWIMVHSGSRNLGKQVADHYNKEAKLFNEKWYSKVNPKWDLAFLPIDSIEGHEYIKEMNYCLEFARANRKLMIDLIREVIDVDVEKELDIHHNYATLENHFGKNVWVHRKGAIRMRKGEIGIIPGSQGTASYIVRGKGNPESFMSASHGAGRLMSRTKARAILNVNDVAKNLNQKGIIHSIRDKTDLDEAPEAYKNIDEVMANQVDLVEIVTKLEPLAVIKG